MLDRLTQAHFAPLLNHIFHVDIDGAQLKVTLADVEALGPASSGLRQPFSLVFRGPREPLLAQRIYAFEQADLGKLEMFLVPIGPDLHGQCYQVIFS